MSKHTLPFIIGLISLIPAGLYGQNSNTGSQQQPPVVKIDQLDVIYDEDEEYVNIIIEPPATTNEDESHMYTTSIITPPPPMQNAVEDDDPDDFPYVLQTNEDEGAESEDEILYVSFDSDHIHYPKLDVNTMTEDVHLVLTHPERGEYYSIPISSTARVSSKFGPRRRRYHYGLDLAAPKGEPIHTMFDGTVRISVRNKSYGNLVVVRHNNGLETYYAHMAQRYVQPGDVVKAGDILGLCGSTGRSTGSHLHLEIRYMGNAMNPEDVINPETRDLKANTLTLNKSTFRRGGSSQKSGTGGGTYSKDGKQYYRVRSGDNLSRIAQRNGTTVSKLCQLNGIHRDAVLQIGKQLRIR
ncbi:MAG: peptidoglycan DD-metalloendopeptidase family protein [Bacteroidales bacterium]|nr:peptidoglycan DD-metalloendopeptidase family protein [Bacteroidales bacterium]